MSEYRGTDSDIDDEGRNLTQQRMDEDGVEDAPVDADWTDADESVTPES